MVETVSTQDPRLKHYRINGQGVKPVIGTAVGPVMVTNHILSYLAEEIPVDMPHNSLQPTLAYPTSLSAHGTASLSRTAHNFISHYVMSSRRLNIAINQVMAILNIQ